MEKMDLKFELNTTTVIVEEDVVDSVLPLFWVLSFFGLHIVNLLKF